MMLPKIKWYRLSFILVISLFLSLGFSQLKPVQIQALEVETSKLIEPPNYLLVSSEISANVWKNGSFPVENFQAYTSPYGYRRDPVNGNVKFHNGLDLAAPRGSYIRNWWTGTVKRVNYDPGCGTSVTIASGAWEHTYCHMEGHVESNRKGRYTIDRQGGISVWEGQQIPSGARIGRIGMTGRTTGPHLHWVLKHNGEYVDPGSVIKEMFKQQNS